MKNNLNTGNPVDNSISKKTLNPRFALFLIFALIAMGFLVTGCGCNVRTTGANNNTDFNTQLLETAAINNLESGEGVVQPLYNPNFPPSTPNTITESGYCIDSGGPTGFNESSFSFLSAQAQQYDSLYNLADRFKPIGNEDHDFLYSHVISLGVAQNTSATISDPRSTDPQIPSPPSSVPNPPANNTTANPYLNQTLMNPASYSLPGGTFKSGGLLGTLGYGGPVTASNNVVTWHNHNTISTNFYPSNFIYLEVGVNKDDPNNTQTSDANAFYVFSFAINPVFVYSPADLANVQAGPSGIEDWNFGVNATSASGYAGIRKQSDLEKVPGQYYQGGSNSSSSISNNFDNNLLLFTGVVAYGNL